MPITWTVEQITAMAPDDQVAKSAKSLACPQQWQDLGQDSQALWGRCKGSGETPYEVMVALDGPAFKCSCPSRKHPCKHGIGLLFLACAEPHILAAGLQPAWAHDWLSGQAARAAQAEQTVSKVAGQIADPAAQARQAQKREQRVRQGIASLALWLEDGIRQGLGSLQTAPASFWEVQAARLVDAQAPGLARRVRDLAAIPATGDGWPGRLLSRLAQLYLLLASFQHLDTLPPALQDEIRSQIGWTFDPVQRGERDSWLVLGQREARQDNLRTRYNWLWGVQRQRAALILDFALAGKSFDYSLVPGTSLDAELIFWPSPTPQRAAIKVQYANRPMRSSAGYSCIEHALAAYGAALARNPWLEPFLMPLAHVVPQQQGQNWLVRDGRNQALPLTLPPGEGWRLLALSSGRPLDLIGEWDGERLALLSVWTGSELVTMGGKG